MIDTDLSKLSAAEMPLHGIKNLWTGDQEGAYAIRHGRRPVNDFGRQRINSSRHIDVNNFFERAFPSLYPYGRGGIEASCPVPVNFNEHIRWSLQYFDCRFRRHQTFPSFRSVSYNVVMR